MRALCLVLLATFAVGCKSKTQPPPAETGTPAAPDGTATDAKPTKPEESEPPLELPEVPQNLDEPMPLPDNILHGTLENGLTYFVRENKKPEKRGEFWLVVNAGSYQEDDDQRGLAHFLEHMAFNGTKEFPKNKLIERLQGLGVEFGPHINASTSFDETVYTLRVPTDDPEAVSLTLKILHEWAQGLTLLKEDIDAERGVVLAEKRTRDGPELRVMMGVVEKVFTGTRYPDRLPIGTPEVLKTAPPEAFKRFYKDWYRADNMAIIAVGDFDGAKVAEDIKKRFGTLPKPTAPKAAPSRKLPVRTKKMFLPLSDKELPLSAVAIARVMPHRQNRSANGLRTYLMEAIATTMLSKRLEEAKRKGDKAYVAAAGGATPLVRAADALFFFAATPPGKMKEALADLMTEVERARRHGFLESEKDRAVKTISSQMESSIREELAQKRNSRSLADELKRHYLTGEAAPGPAMELALLKHYAGKVAMEEFVKVLDDLVNSKDLIVAALAPSPEQLISENDAWATLDAAKRATVEAYTDVNANTPLIQNTPTAGSIASESFDKEVGVTVWKLENGATVMLKATDFQQDQIVVIAQSPGGLSRVKTDALGKTRQAATSVLEGGLGQHDQVTLDKLLAGKKVSISASITETEETLSGASSKKDVEALFQMLHLAFTAPRKDPAAFAVWKQRMTEALTLSANKPETLFVRKLARFRDKDNPRTVPMDETVIKGVELDASLALFRDRFRDADDFTFAIVGRFDKEAIKPLVLSYIGSLEKDPRTESYDIHHWPVHEKQARLVVAEGTEPRAQLSFYYKKKLDPAKVSKVDRLAWYIFAEALKLDLREQFREQLGATYGVNVVTALPQKRNYAVFAVEFICDPNQADKLEKAALASIAKAVNSGADPQSIDKSVLALTKAHESRLEDNSYWATALLRVALRDEPLAEVAALLPRIKSLKPANVNDVAKRFIDTDRAAIGRFMPKK